MTTTPDTSRSALVRPPRELVSSTAFLLKRLGGMVKDQVLRAFEDDGASPYHYGVLAVLEEGARDTQATVADALGYDRSYLVGLLDELEQRGMIDRRRDPADRRRHVVKLTAEGKKYLARLRALHESVDDEMLSPLTTEERAQLHSLLHRLVAHHDPRYGNGQD